MLDETPPENAEQLGRAYADVLGRQNWEVDVLPPSMEPLELAAVVDDAGAITAPVASAEPLAPERIIEAMLFVGGLPLTAERACEAIRGLTPPQFVQLADQLEHKYRSEGRPYAVHFHGGGYCLELRPRYRTVLDRLSGGVREVRLSPMAIDALSLVAYRQPLTKQEIDTIRGAESGGLLRQLVRHGLIAVTANGASRSEATYMTTDRFLEMFGLKDLDDLPQTQDLERL